MKVTVLEVGGLFWSVYPEQPQSRRIHPFNPHIFFWWSLHCHWKLGDWKNLKIWKQEENIHEVPISVHGSVPSWSAASNIARGPVPIQGKIISETQTGIVCVVQICPLPQADRTVKWRNTARKVEILSGSSYKNVLEGKDKKSDR